MIVDPHKEFAYPDDLPEIDPKWRADKRIQERGREITESKDWGQLDDIADRLEELGCRDVEMLDHFRSRWICMYCNGQQRMTGHRGEEIPCLSCTAGKHRSYNAHRYGCWCNQCWLLDHLLGDDQTLKAIKLPKRFCGEDATAEVINPGAWFGKTWVVLSADTYSPPLFIVEADSPDAAIDEFVESERIEGLTVDPDDQFDNRDYGYRVHVGDQIGGIKIDFDGWVDLKGQRVEDERMEPSTTGQGVLYDGDNIQLLEAPDVRYIGPGLPREGVPAVRYEDSHLCCGCWRRAYPTSKKGEPPDFHSIECCIRALALHGLEVKASPG